MLSIEIVVMYFRIQSNPEYDMRMSNRLVTSRESWGVVRFLCMVSLQAAHAKKANHSPNLARSDQPIRC